VGAREECGEGEKGTLEGDRLGKKRGGRGGHGREGGKGKVSGEGGRSPTHKGKSGRKNFRPTFDLTLERPWCPKTQRGKSNSLARPRDLESAKERGLGDVAAAAGRGGINPRLCML